RWSVRSLVSEPLKLHSVKDVDGRVDEVMAEVGLHRDLLRRRPADLSGGERQRVAIGRAIAIRPAVLVLDEPTASVDMSMRRSLLALLRRLQEEQQLTCLYISHDIRTVEETCTRTVVMYRGKLVEEGPTDEVLNSPSDSYTRRLMAAVPRLGRARPGSAPAASIGRPPPGDVDA
ncbi:MAG: ABC transporter ATP-binding protein, partial [Acidimicrobiales bacterium]